MPALTDALRSELLEAARGSAGSTSASISDPLVSSLYSGLIHECGLLDSLADGCSSGSCSPAASEESSVFRSRGLVSLQPTPASAVSPPAEERPSDPPSAPADPPDASGIQTPSGGWKQATDPATGKPYWWQVHTRAVAWSLPPGAEVLAEAARKRRPAEVEQRQPAARDLMHRVEAGLRGNAAVMMQPSRSDAGCGDREGLWRAGGAETSGACRRLLLREQRQLQGRQQPVRASPPRPVLEQSPCAGAAVM
eukprot:TRINITY_DN35916_c0_g1_i1.p2 TRINITY_DN35916_c0_g1~~TRINITY_DN35916_c0_g1_i1.p2  ORF type:complete len:269 (+),score=85.45 TRINITY_DN35916_c0_g1_i1:52-807(+)